MLKTILAPLDFSENSIAAGEHAVVIANRFDSNVIFLHVLDSPRASRTITDARQKMDSIVAKVSGGRKIDCQFAHGDIAHEIEKVIRAAPVDLVVMPTHGHGPFRRFLMGSITGKVLHDVECAVLTGRHVPDVPDYASTPYARIACAIDLDEHSESILRWTSSFVEAWGAELTVIHAVESPDVNPLYGEFMISTEKRAMAEAEQALVKQMEKAGCRGKRKLTAGRPEDCIPEAAADARSDILIIGRSRHHGPLGRLRSHAYSLIRESPCPVISL